MQSSQRERYVDVAWDSRPIITAGLKIQFLAHQSAPNPARLEREFIRTQQQHRHRAILQPLAPPPWDQGIVTSYCWKLRPLGINPLPVVVRYPPGVAAKTRRLRVLIGLCPSRLHLVNCVSTGGCQTLSTRGTTT